MHLSWGFLADSSYQQSLLKGLRLTLTLSAIVIVVSTIGGLLFTLLRTIGPNILRLPIRIYVDFIRNTPPVIQLFFWYFSVPFLLPHAQYPLLYSGDFEFNIAAAALSIYGIAFVGEAIRGGIESVPKGQWEAAAVLGLRPAQALRLVIARQSLPIVLPACSNEYIGLLKWTAIAMTIAVPELTWQAQKIESDLFRGFEAITLITVVYMSLCLMVGLAMRLCEVLFSPIGISSGVRR